MSHTNTTPNYGLPQFITTDKPAWLTDINGAFSAIDTGIDGAKDAADAAQADATQAISDAAAAGSAATGANTKASGAIASLAENFETTNTYTIGQLVIYNNLLYKCISAVNVPGPWNSSKWVRIDLDDIYRELISAIQTKASKIEYAYNYHGTVINTLGGSLRGFGAAAITLDNGIARIDFAAKISVNETTSGINTWGVNRDYFTSITGKTINPVAGGVMTVYASDGSVLDSRTDFSGTFLQNGQFWQPARVYDNSGVYDVGGWASATFAAGQRIIGTCYGTYS